jgi:AraC-like DNA-binding protein
MAHPRRELLLLAADFPDAPELLGGYATRPAGSWAELRDRVRSARPSAVALVRAGGAGEGVDRVRDLVRETPSVPVMAAVSFGEADAGHLRAIVAAGAAELVNLGGVSSLDAVVPMLRRAHAQPLKRRMEVRLPVWVSEDARTLLRAAAETVTDRGGRDLFAEIFGVNPRTLSGHCTELDLPPPRRLLAWMRVVLAAALLEEPGRTVLNVALSSGYNDSSSLKRAIESLIGPPPAGGVREETFDRAWDGFIDEIRQLRYAR